MHPVRLAFLVIFIIVSFAIISGCNGPREAQQNTTAAPSTVWQHKYGGPSDEDGYSVVQTGDGGYAIGGTRSVDDSAGYPYEALIIKTDAAGNELWNRSYGGIANLYSFAGTRDGGFILVSSDRLIRTDASGSELWNKSYEWGEDAYISSIVESGDNGYVYTGSAGPAASGDRILLVKIDGNGQVVWNRTYEGGTGEKIISTDDGGYAIAGSTTVLKTDAAGNVLWQNDYGSELKKGLPNTTNPSAVADLYSIIQAGDGGYILTGTTGTITRTNLDDPKSSKLSGNISTKFELDYLLAKVGANGSLLWARTYGGTGLHEALETVPAGNGGYVIAGIFKNNSTDYYLRPFTILSDSNYTTYLVGTDVSGNELWHGYYSVDYTTHCADIIRTADGGYVMTGRTRPEKSANVPYDIFLVKVA